MKRRIERFLAPLIIGFVLVGVLAATLNRLPVQAAPAALGPVQVFTLNTASIAATTTFTPTATGGRWSDIGGDTPATSAEIWLLVDETTANTTTFVLQVSPDGTTWINHSTGSALASNVAADSNTYTVARIEGIYYKIVATVTNSNPLTPTIRVVLR